MNEPQARPRLIAVDMDGTLLGSDGRISAANAAALHMAEAAGIEVVVATGRRHCYAMHVLRGLGLRPDSALVSSNGTVIRTLDAELLHCTHMEISTAQWLCKHVDAFRQTLVLTFDLVGHDGEDSRGALVVEDPKELHRSIGRWMEVNAPYIEAVQPLEDALHGDAPIQMMLCGTVARMRAAEALLLEHPRVAPVGAAPGSAGDTDIALHRTEYPDRDLCILDILPARCSKASALEHLAGLRGIETSEILAIGDNWNDVPMLELAGRAVVMANAPEDLKMLAAGRGWTIGPSNDDDGVAVAIQGALAGALAGAR